MGLYFPRVIVLSFISVRNGSGLVAFPAPLKNASDNAQGHFHFHTFLHLSYIFRNLKELAPEFKRTPGPVDTLKPAIFIAYFNHKDKKIIGTISVLSYFPYLCINTIKHNSHEHQLKLPPHSGPIGPTHSRH